ncbi:hypothetical protein PV327_002922 [Microctonus hyperodae]|uniref:L-lactate dehydrogenase n=1 Tax=Microctonus hyperodae TaxID=165561 RepID=A0AA39G2Y4_MICHY|nr:hypothetical protein PV327_002922 [Microctonus hyperodae]
MEMSEDNNEKKVLNNSVEPAIVPARRITTTTKNALITTQLNQCDTYPHRVKVSIVGVGNVGMACAMTILMRRMASEVCLIDKNAARAEAEAEDIRHAGVFLGNPLVIGTQDITMVKESAVVIIAVGEPASGEQPNIQHNLEIFRKVIPAIAKFACRAILLITTRPIEIMTYITWKLSNFPSSRVLGTGTLVDTVRLQYHLAQRMGVANTSISCMIIGTQGDTSVPIWSSAHVAGTKLTEINPKMGEKNDPERWYEVTNAVNEMESKLSDELGVKGPSCWCLALCTVEIVDAILRNTKVVLPVTTYIHSHSHGSDKGVYMSVPCVLGKEGVHHALRQKLTDQEKLKIQACANGIRNVLREYGILEELRDNDNNNNNNHNNNDDDDKVT